ncbi:MAG: bifunctional folylpolyglutamate synthase/dihydrofolate synthase [Alistipes sp.]|nr:bifunctional folylpolyglutamate synthase/dihydrofolate synthase [Alistipes sp.]MCD7970503.1 bifunctional folylpolyglutamate synthase/dihydrofolate synthase [Alistipes sp.]
MDYKQTLDKLYGMLPDFQQVGADAYKPGLERIEAFCSLLGNPQRDFRIVHIAGTNGKGSVSHMLSSVLTAAGYRTGLYTSPHLRDFRERIRVDGETVSEEDVVRFAARYMERMEACGLSFFEATAAMAFRYFSDRGADFAVVETGLGGRLDATNIVDPVLSVVTNIGLDHMAQLGNDLPSIAFEKAGIIKPGVPVVIGERDHETDPVFEAAARERGCEIIFAQDLFRYVSSDGPNGTAGCDDPGTTLYNIEHLRTGEVHGYRCDLGGIYQRRNIVSLLGAVDTLRNKCGVEIPAESLLTGLTTAALSTGLRGRWQVLGRSPLVVCDTGHNAHGMEQVARQIVSQNYHRLFMVLGMVRDKDLDAVLPLLPKDAYYIFTSPSIRRTLPADELAQAGNRHGLAGETCPTVGQAVERALSMATPEDMVFIGGSTFTVAELTDL